MWPTLVENDLVRCEYFFWGRRRIVLNDIVAFAPPSVNGTSSKSKADFHVKRVIGTPGDRIEVIPSIGVSVNGRILNEQNHVANKAEYALKSLGDIGGMIAAGESVRPFFQTDRAAEPIVVPANHFFLLGDNRNVSIDSHVYGFVDERYIRARIYSLRSRDLRTKELLWKCTFCEASQAQVKYLMQGLGGYVCTECISTLSMASAQIPETTARCTLCLQWRDAKQIRFSQKVSGGRACADCVQTAVDAQKPYLEANIEAAKPLDFGSALSQAATFLHFGDGDRGRAFAELALQKKPDDSRALSMLSTALLLCERAEEALAVARKASDSSDDKATTKLLVVHALFALAKYDEALEACNGVVERHPSSGDAIGLRSAIYIKQRKWREALTDARRALAEEPHNGGVHANVAYCQLELGNLEEATHAVEKALYCNVRLAPAYRTRGRIRMAKNQYMPAVEDFTTAIKLEPNKAEFFALRASAYQALAEKELANADLQKARDLGWSEESEVIT